jgi:hypothetical protein
MGYKLGEGGEAGVWVLWIQGVTQAATSWLIHSPVWNICQVGMSYGFTLKLKIKTDF